MATTKAFAATRQGAALAPFTFERREPRDRDVAIDILYCGVCHSDIHTARNEWGGTTYPCVPGHEIVGRVSAVGAAVKKVKPGDRVGVGCMVASCGDCRECRAGYEQYCERGATFTYNSEDRVSGGVTYGGYSDRIVVDEAFVLRIGERLDPAAAAPLLCAGITTYSPLRHWNVGKGTKVGIVGLGGLGHMGVKLAKAFGAHVVLFTTSAKKVEDGLRLGADEVVVSKDAEAMKARTKSLDFILDTVSADHDVDALLALLRRDGALCMVGLPSTPLSVRAGRLAFGRRHLTGSGIGGIPETQEMLDFCAEHGIVSDVEVIPIQEINRAYDRVVASDVRYRFVIDMASLR